jgi:hypothetical protein
MNKKLGLMVGALFALTAAQSVMADCKAVSRDQLQAAANAAAASDLTGGYGLPMWVTMVDETGMVCHVVTSEPSTSGAGGTYWDTTNGSGANDGADSGNTQWLGSRVISAQKANTANAFNVNGYAISTANLYTPVQTGNSLYGLQHSNPVDASRAYGGSPNTYGTKSDYLKNKRIGGVNVFGGGLALYNGNKKVGAIGVSGDTSCRDHAFAWLVRQNVNLQPSGMVGITTFNVNASGGANTPSAVGTVGDEMIINGSGGWQGWQHPACPNTATGTAIGVIDMAD